MKRNGFMVCLIILMTGCFHLCIEYPVERQIMNVSELYTRARFKCPARSSHYRFVIGLPYINGKCDWERKPPHFSGTVKVVSGTNVIYNLPIQETKLTPCNWLTHKHNLDGWIVDFKQSLTNFVIGNEYEVQVDLADNPDTTFSLWLCYLGYGKLDR